MTYIYEAYIFLQNISAKHLADFPLGENNNNNNAFAPQHRCMCYLIPCQCNPQAIGFIYFISPLLDHLLTNPLLPVTSKIIRLKGKHNAHYLRGAFVPSVNSFVQSKCMRSVLEFMQNFIFRRHQKVSDWKVWRWFLFPLTELIGKSQIRMPDLTMINGPTLPLLSCKSGDPV